MHFVHHRRSSSMIGVIFVDVQYRTRRGLGMTFDVRVLPVFGYFPLDLNRRLILIRLHIRDEKTPNRLTELVFRYSILQV